MRRTIAGIEVEELYEMQGREKVYIGRVKKIKLIDKTKAIEMLGKKLDMFIDKVHVSGEVQVKHSVEGLIWRNGSRLEAGPARERAGSYIRRGRRTRINPWR